MKDMNSITKAFNETLEEQNDKEMLNVSQFEKRIKPGTLNMGSLAAIVSVIGSSDAMDLESFFRVMCEDLKEFNCLYFITNVTIALIKGMRIRHVLYIIRLMSRSETRTFEFAESLRSKIQRVFHCATKGGTIKIRRSKSSEDIVCLALAMMCLLSDKFEGTSFCHNSSLNFLCDKQHIAVNVEILRNEQALDSTIGVVKLLSGGEEIYGSVVGMIAESYFTNFKMILVGQDDEEQGSHIVSISKFSFFGTVEKLQKDNVEGQRRNSVAYSIEKYFRNNDLKNMFFGAMREQESKLQLLALLIQTFSNAPEILQFSQSLDIIAPYILPNRPWHSKMLKTHKVTDPAAVLLTAVAFGPNAFERNAIIELLSEDVDKAQLNKMLKGWKEGQVLLKDADFQEFYKQALTGKIDVAKIGGVGELDCNGIVRFVQALELLRVDVIRHARNPIFDGEYNLGKSQKDIFDVGASIIKPEFFDNPVNQPVIIFVGFLTFVTFIFFSVRALLV